MEISIGELGASTDVDGDGAFSDTEWVTLNGDFLEIYNTRFGLPNCTDNLSCVNLTYEQEYQLVNLDCGALMAKRRYRTHDSQVGNPSDWAEQHITVNYVPDWTLTFPADVNLTCADGNIPPPATATDIIDAGSCDLWALEVIEKTFIIGSIGNCIKTERTYELINWCSYAAGDAAIVVPHHPNGATLSHTDANVKGRFIYTQLINISITEAPTVIINEVNTCIVGVGYALPYNEEDTNLGVAPFECE